MLPNHLLPTKTERAEFARACHFIIAPRGVTPEMVVDPDFWVHLAGRRLRVFDRIEIVAEDGTFEAELRVMSLDPRGLWAQVRPISGVDAKGAPLSFGAKREAVAPAGQYPDKDGYSIEFSGPHNWRILRGTDLVAKDFATEEDAAAALRNIKSAKRQARAAA